MLFFKCWSIDVETRQRGARGDFQPKRVTVLAQGDVQAVIRAVDKCHAEGLETRFAKVAS